MNFYLINHNQKIVLILKNNYNNAYGITNSISIEMRRYLISKQEENQTLEKFTKKVLSEVSLSVIQKLFRKKDVKVNGHWQDKKYIVKEGDEISIYIPESKIEEVNREIKSRDVISQYIIYEDKNILIINKPRGILTQKGNARDYALDQMVLEYLTYKNEYDPNRDNGFTPAPAHRLDRNTSGLIIFGKNLNSLQTLFELFKNKSNLEKHYISLVKGEILEDGEVNAPLKKEESTGKVIVDSIKDGAKNAKTIYQVIKRYDGYTLLDLNLITGRTHQIRVHMQYINHPVIGDSKYGDFDENRYFEKYFNFKHQFLHASRNIFKNLDGELSYLTNRDFKADLNEEYKNILKKI